MSNKSIHPCPVHGYGYGVDYSYDSVFTFVVGGFMTKVVAFIMWVAILGFFFGR